MGVVGVGYVGQFHAEKYAKMEGVELVGVVDIVPSRAKEVATRYGTQSFFHHSDLLDRVQAVSIAVPTPSHHSITKDFFLHGVHVLLEKPITSALHEADELIWLAESSGLVLQVGHLERFNGALLATEGRIKSPIFIESHRLGPFTERAAEVDVVIDLMIHDIDIVLNVIRSPVKEIHAVGLPVLTSHADFAHAWIQFENGRVASLTASRVSTEKIRRMRVFQPDGILTIDYLAQKASFMEKRPSSEKNGIAEAVAEEISVVKVDALEAEIRAFINCIRFGKEVRVSGRDGRRALEVALQILAKIGQGLSEGDG